MHILDLPDEILRCIVDHVVGKKNARRSFKALYIANHCEITASTGLLTRELCRVHDRRPLLDAYDRLMLFKYDALHGDDLILSRFIRPIYFSHACCGGNGLVYRIFKDDDKKSVLYRCYEASE